MFVDGFVKMKRAFVGIGNTWVIIAIV